MKKNAVVFFFKSLLRSILVIVSILAVGVISYKVSYEVLSKQMEEGTLEMKEQELEDILDQAQKDEISKNLIYVVDDEEKITHMLLEICNTKTYNMDYVTIPTRTDYVIPSKMYQKLCVVEEEIPQIVRLAKLKQYFPDIEDEKAYGYAELIMEKALGIDISYYTVISEEIYESRCQEVEATTSYTKVMEETEADSAESSEEATDAPKQEYTMSVTMKLSVASDSYLNQLEAIKGDESQLMDFIKAQYEQEGWMSNLTVYNKIGYVEAYAKMNASFNHYWGIPGERSDKLFTIDGASSKKFLAELENNEESYTDVQSFGKVTKKKGISSKRKKILVLNGSKISGLAASKQEELINAGFNVPKVGDYTDEILTQTRIIVTKDRMGQDLAAYFKNPQIVVGTVEEGYDIEIILGTVDAN